MHLVSADRHTLRASGQCFMFVQANFHPAAYCPVQRSSKRPLCLRSQRHSRQDHCQRTCAKPAYTGPSANPVHNAGTGIVSMQVKAMTVQKAAFRKSYFLPQGLLSNTKTSELGFFNSKSNCGTGVSKLSSNTGSCCNRILQKSTCFKQHC